MQEYWKQRRESLIVDIQSLEKATQFKAVGEQDWASLDRKAIRLLSKLKREAVTTSTRNAWKLWRQFGRHTISTVWSLRRVIQSNIRPRLMLCVGKIARPEYPFTVYEAGLQGKNRQRTLWVNGLDQERISETMPFLWVEFASSGTVMCRIYPETDTTPISTAINRDLGVSFQTSIPLDGMVPIAFRDHLQTIRPLFASFIDLARRDDSHRRMLYKLKRLNEELQRFDRTEKKWDKIYLPAEQKIDLIKQMDVFLNSSANAPQALLLKGGPGTGKTMLAHTMADVAGSKFYKLSISDIKHPHLGESAQRVAQIWKEVRANKPAILFLDECESLFGKRGAAETDVIGTDIVQAFLSQWNGKESDIWVIAATNRREMIDGAILSRFGTEMEIALPDEESRRLILEQELKQNGAEVCVSPEVARQMQGFSGRDIAMLAGKITTDARPGKPTLEIMLCAIRKERVSSNSGVDSGATWNSLVLAPETMTSIQTVCSMLKDAEGWKSTGATIPAGVLLTGPPGTGKTQIARTMANESGLGFIAASTADIKAGFTG